MECGRDAALLRFGFIFVSGLLRRRWKRKNQIAYIQSFNCCGWVQSCLFGLYIHGGMLECNEMNILPILSLYVGLWAGLCSQANASVLSRDVC